MSGILQTLIATSGSDLGNKVISFTIGSGGSGSVVSVAGNGTNTTVTFQGSSIVGGGGIGGRYNDNSVPGAGGTFSGTAIGANGGSGGAVSGDNGGGGGGGIAGANATSPYAGSAGQDGKAGNDISGLQAALTALSINFTSFGAGSVGGSPATGNLNNGGAAAGFGCGGGGAGWYGGIGGVPNYGAGGGGGSGYDGTANSGANGGGGAVIVQMIVNGVYQYQFFGAGSSYTTPAGTNYVKIWAIGAGGGGAGGSADNTSGGGGGAGGTAVRVWS